MIYPNGIEHISMSYIKFLLLTSLLFLIPVDFLWAPTLAATHGFYVAAGPTATLYIVRKMCNF